MVKVYSIDGVTPVVHPEAFVHPSAVLIGDVIVGPGVYIGPCASLRGDFGRIRVEAGANVQDCCIIHGFPNADTVIETNGHIGHAAIIHGARVRANALVGMNAVVNDNAEVGEWAIVAAMAFVKADMKCRRARSWRVSLRKSCASSRSRSVPGKADATRLYQNLAVRSLATMKETVALTAPEANRPSLPLPRCCRSRRGRRNTAGGQ